MRRLILLAAGVWLAWSAPLAFATPPTEINVEVDYMYAFDHVHRLNPDEIAMIVQMFACQGIVMTIEVSDSITEQTVLSTDGTGSFFENSQTEPDGFLTLKNQYFDHSGDPGWHYCIMAHQYALGGPPTSSSGYAEIHGDDFVVTLGTWFAQVGYPIDRAGTFAHELGHNLGLLHTGNQSSAVFQYKPNYASVMTYRYQVWGVRSYMECAGMTDGCHIVPLKVLDYSHGQLLTLTESALDENFGVGLGPVDWNCNFSIDAAPVAVDLSSDWDWCINAGAQTMISDYDDWSNIQDATFAKSANSLVRLESVSCITLEEAETLRSLKGAACVWYPNPVSVEPCVEPAPDDPDMDLVRDACDNCPNDFNPDQADANDNGIGDVCEVTCACPFQGDADADGFITSVDLSSVIDALFNSGANPQDPACPTFRFDLDCDGFTTALDLSAIITHLFEGGAGPCDPCAA